MADKKISELVDASTPLAGTELIPLVQGGATVKVAAADLIGAVGPTGADGVVGPTGADGAEGPTGATGDLPGGGMSDTVVFVDNATQSHTVVIVAGIITSWTVA